MTNETTTALPLGRRFFNKSKLHDDARKVCSQLPKAERTLFGRGSKGVRESADAAKIAALPAVKALVWLNIDGSHVPKETPCDAEHDWLTMLAEVFGFHELAVEDVRNRRQRAKLDRFNDGSCTPHLFVVVRIPDANHPGETEQLSLFLRDNLVVTVQEAPGGDCFTKRMQGIEAASLRGELTAGLLAAELLDAAVMDYMAHLPGPEEEIEKLRARAGKSATDGLIADLHGFRGEALHLLRDIKPLEDVLSHLASVEDDFVSPAARAKFKDALDHQQRAVDTLNHLADESKELMNLTLAMASHKMNEVMQVLTIVSALLIPPTLIAGVYGMNFQHMPELGWQHGYLFAIGLMLLLAGIQIWLFVQNGWWVNPFRFKKGGTISTLLTRGKHGQHRSP
ncbi:MAG: hypothetical protein HQ461_03545 [Deltaproteobacteria bacterium]|nr:hypothetical protein [Deltaproteobacteria bacterium]